MDEVKLIARSVLPESAATVLGGYMSKVEAGIVDESCAVVEGIGSHIGVVKLGGTSNSPESFHMG
jgi:hypothetical protein